MLNFYLDVNLYTGIEYIYIAGFGKTNGTELDMYTNEYEEETVYDLELLYDTGNVNVKRTYDVSVIKENEFVEVMMDRVLQKKNVDKSLEKRNTGFQLEWYYEDGSGNRVKVEEENKFEEDTDNKKFVTFMNLVFEAVTRHQVGLETLWDIGKDYRLDYTHRLVNNKVTFCKMLGVIDTDDYLNYFSSALGIPFTLQDTPVYKNKISDSLLSEGYKLFHYIARCKDMNFVAKDTLKIHIESFNKDSNNILLEAATGIHNIDRKLNTGKDFLGKNSAAELMKMMNEVFDLNIYKLELLASEADNLEELRDEQLRTKLKTCLKNAKCEDLKELINDQGICCFIN